MEEQKERKHITKLKELYNKNYKLLFIATAVLILLSIAYLAFFYLQNHDFIYKDISLQGGTSVTIYTNNLSINQLKIDLTKQLGEIDITETKDIITQQEKAVIIDTSKDSSTTKQILQNYLGYNLTSQNSSFESTSPTLGGSFYEQLLIALLTAFVFMSIVVFILFRTFIPSFAVILSAFADILMALVTVDLMGMKLSTAGIIAFLMLIGYSVDTDILLTNRVLKRTDGTINHKIFGAFKTGITMTLTALVVTLSALIITGSFSSSLSQIFTVLSIGLAFDIYNTWVTNASIIKWYATKKQK